MNSNQIRTPRPAAAALALAAIAALATSGAEAATTTFKFFNGTGPAVVTGSTDAATVTSPQSCTSGDVCGKLLEYSDGTPALTLDVTATAPSVASATVIQDLTPNFGGLGVYEGLSKLSVDKYNNVTWVKDDNIGPGETLTLTFDKQVTITDLVFYDKDHAVDWGGASFALSINGGTAANYALQNVFSPAGGLVGTSFTFSSLAGTGNQSQCVKWSTYDGGGYDQHGNYKDWGGYDEHGNQKSGGKYKYGGKDDSKPDGNVQKKGSYKKSGQSGSYTYRKVSVKKSSRTKSGNRKSGRDGDKFCKEWTNPDAMYYVSAAVVSYEGGFPGSGDPNVPAPATLLLLATGLIGLGLRRRAPRETERTA